MPDSFTRTVRAVDVTRPALVLGSTQPAVDPAGIEVVRRRSGGGAVLVGPGEVAWVDVLVPAGDPLWEEDVGVAFHWLGRVWVRALEALGVGADWHRGPMVCTAWCRQVCFAGLGPGEVTSGAHKVVGISQRRTRAGSLFQCAALLRWDPQAMVNLLGLEPEATADLARMAAPLHATASDIEEAFVAAIDAAASGSA